MKSQNLHKPEITKVYLKYGKVHILETPKYAHRFLTHHVFENLDVIEQHFGTDYRKACEAAIQA
jgi:quinol monooxygenase YgiN